MKKLLLYAIIGGQFLVFSPVFAATDYYNSVSRARNTTYQNSTLDRHIYTKSSVSDTANFAVSSTSNLTCDNTTNTHYDLLDSNGTLTEHIFSVFIPPNAYYCFGSTGSPAFWYEIDTNAMGSSTISNSTTTNLIASSGVPFVVNNNNQDIYNGIILMWGMIWFVIWFFKIERKTKQS